MAMRKMKNLDRLLEDDGDVNGSILEIDDFIVKLCNYGEEMEELTEPQKQFYYNQNLEKEVNNGGFSQYFINSSGDFAHETVLSLRAIGADKTAEILQQAIDQFPNKRVPKDREERIRMVEKIEPKANDEWNRLDSKFFEYQDDLSLLNLDFVRKHKSSF